MSFALATPIRRARAVETRGYPINRFVAVSPLDNSATMTRQRRVACQPGATPRERVRAHVPPLQGAPIDSETQGVALGWSAAALSAPESKLSKSEFTTLGG